MLISLTVDADMLLSVVSAVTKAKLGLEVL